MTYVYVVLGGGLGAALRLWVGSLITMNVLGVPLAILAVNILGCGIAGFVVELFKHTPELRLFLLTGVLGGFTTFSAFSIETLKLIDMKQYHLALVYVGLSVFVSILSAAVGLKLAGYIAN